MKFFQTSVAPGRYLRGKQGQFKPDSLTRAGYLRRITSRRIKSESLPSLAARRTPMAASSLATLRSKIEADLRGRVASPFAYRDRNAFELVSTGVSEMDALVGGLPRGAMTEICGAACSGRTTLLLSAFASRTAEGGGWGRVGCRDS